MFLPNRTFSPDGGLVPQDTSDSAAGQCHAGRCAGASVDCWTHRTCPRDLMLGAQVEGRAH